MNLLHNAVKFSPDGGDVTVTVRRDADRVVASVADHGSGIPKAAQPRLFERFYKVDRHAFAARPAGRVSGSPSRATSSSSMVADLGRIDGGPRHDILVLPICRRSLGPMAGTTADRPEDPMDRLHVATLNILNLSDRWPSGCR